ncbi:MAG: enoyl-CoA hydratase [Sphingomonadales bacterium]|nr:enoyl-CoA hydratase [Sphingomonadales bacterium]MBU3992784.1 enoyl-CoA hydratase/isomerase family protein [Alphaproteobacteria bacterium]
MDYSGYKHILVEVENRVATVTLNRPEVRNAATLEVHTELEDIWLKIARDEAVHAIVLTGAGVAFSAGGDINAMHQRLQVEGANLAHSMRAAGHTRRLWEAMLGVEQPIIAAINGDALGLGCNMAVFSDITVIANDAKIGDTHTRMGLVAGDGGAVMFPILLGFMKAKEFLMRGLIVKGEEAARIGLCTYAYPKDQVLAEARKIADELAALPTYAVRWTKLAAQKTVKDHFNATFDVSIAYEMLGMQDKPFSEAVHAFIEKRKPNFG